MTRRALILVEGQTEERFVKQVLAPVLQAQQLYVIPTLLVTKLVKDGSNFKGGVTRYGKFRDDLRRLLNGAGTDALVTTLVDYYGLPDDFPGMSGRGSLTTPRQRVEHVQSAIEVSLGRPRNLRVFLALHEFEAWLFAGPRTLAETMTEPLKVTELEDIRATAGMPEEINEHPQTAPSKRIQSLFPTYRKTLHGPIVTSRIGLVQIRADCPHFDAWMTDLERFAIDGTLPGEHSAPGA